MFESYGFGVHIATHAFATEGDADELANEGRTQVGCCVPALSLYGRYMLDAMQMEAGMGQVPPFAVANLPAVERSVIWRGPLCVHSIQCRCGRRGIQSLTGDEQRLLSLHAK